MLGSIVSVKPTDKYCWSLTGSAVILITSESSISMNYLLNYFDVNEYVYHVLMLYELADGRHHPVKNLTQKVKLK